MSASAAPAAPVSAPVPRGPALPYRATFLDAARGTAMLLVFMNHFLWIYFNRRDGGILPEVLRGIGQIATPTFMGISGLLLGFLFVVRPARFDGFRIKLTDRALFLLTVVVLLDAIAYIPLVGGLPEGFRWAPITNAIGVCLLLGPPLMRRLGSRERVALGLSILAMSWVIAANWWPNPLWLRYVKETLFGTVANHVYGYNFPAFPWFGFYLTATAFGEWLGTTYKAGDAHLIVRRLVGMGIAGIVTGATVKVAYEVACRLLEQRPLFGPVSHMLLSPFQKWPPGPFFYLFYGGWACLVLVTCFLLERSGRFARALGFVTILGQISLFVFVLQDFVYVGLLTLLRLPLTSLWPVFFLLSVGLIAVIALAWNRMGWNRFITVGYGRNWGPRSPDRDAAA